MLQFGFPIDINRSCTLSQKAGNHSSATKFPDDVDTYIKEESKLDSYRVIIDLILPLGASGIAINTHLCTSSCCSVSNCRKHQIQTKMYVLRYPSIHHMFQCLSNILLYVTHSRASTSLIILMTMLGWVVLTLRHTSFTSFFELIEDLGLTISDQKWYPLAQSGLFRCLCTENLISFAPDQWNQINDTVTRWICKENNATTYYVF